MGRRDKEVDEQDPRCYSPRTLASFARVRRPSEHPRDRLRPGSGSPDRVTRRTPPRHSGNRRWGDGRDETEVPFVVTGGGTRRRGQSGKVVHLHQTYDTEPEVLTFIPFGKSLFINSSF